MISFRYGRRPVIWVSWPYVLRVNCHMAFYRDDLVGIWFWREPLSFFFNFIVVWIGSIYHRVTLKRKIMFKCWTIRQLALEPNSCWHEWPKLSTSIMWKVTDEKQSEAWTRISCCLPRRKVETDQMRTGMDSVLSKFSNDLFRCQVFKRVVISMRHSFHMERVYQTSIQDWW